MASGSLLPILSPRTPSSSNLQFPVSCSFSLFPTYGKNDIKPYWKCRAVSLDYSPSTPSSSSCNATAPICSSGGTSLAAVKSKENFVVVNFYHFVLIEDYELQVSRHLSFLQGLDIHGRIYLNEQGINAQFSGPTNDALAYVEWLREDDRFSDILVQISPSINGHAFPRLKLRYKPSLVQFEGGDLELPLHDPSMRAAPLIPAEWRQRLEQHATDGYASCEDHNKNYILLDVRNGYEWDIGHFHGAVRPEVDCFKSTSFGLSKMEVSDLDPLANIDKDKTDVLMYCTGGIRCDVYSTILRQKGFKRLYTLKGGVSHYLKEEGPVAWIGNLFVFDSRLSLPPSLLRPGSDQAGSRILKLEGNSRFARCYLCGSQVHELKHRNCANLDCNQLFLVCAKCVEELRGCCCSECKSAPRLRPVLHGVYRYNKWHHYRDNGTRHQISSPIISIWLHPTRTSCVSVLQVTLATWEGSSLTRLK